jgi:hypothetical protein
MLNDIGKIDGVLRPDIVKGSRDRNSQGNSKEQSPTPDPQTTTQEESEEENPSSHLLDIRI